MDPESTRKPDADQDRTPSGRTPAQTARMVALIVLGVIVVVLLIFLVIGLIEGDESRDFDDRQPEPSADVTES